MSRFRILLFTVVGILMSASIAFAQVEAATGAGDNASSVNKYRAIAAGIGFAIAVLGGALGQSRIGAAACEGAARNPGAAGRIQTMMILGLALIESLVLFALLVIFAVVKPVVT
ncbi:MAG TPA: ATP synthase F0 subunit C [Pyrinomonadaceae bacterium]|nr:ATP synthase F0 subunit C [Pyrinomonadaceae bacterium]